MKCSYAGSRKRAAYAFVSSRSFAIIILLIIAFLGTTQAVFAQASNYCDWNGPWASTGGLNFGRQDATITRLNDGRVLIAGGDDGVNTQAVAELYDPATGSFTTTGSLATSRSSHIAELLPDGRVLIAGGRNVVNGAMVARLASAEIYDPATGQFTAAAPMTNPRQDASSVRLADGRILVTGGFGPTPYPYSTWLNTAEIFDPATGAFTATGSMVTGRGVHTSTRLPNGRILVAGGTNAGGWTNLAEVYDPATGSFASTGAMQQARQGHTATLVNDQVLITGGFGASGYLASTEKYYPDGHFSLSGSMSAPRVKHTVTLLPSGKVLVAGGINANGEVQAAEWSDITSTGFTPLPAMPVVRSGHTAAVLADGKVLLVGGKAGTPAMASAILFDPLFAFAGRMSAIRIEHTATWLATGEVLLAGGGSPSIPTATADVYSTVTRSISPVGSMSTPRHYHSATRLADGRVLVAGGLNGPSSGSLASAEIYDPFSRTFSPAGSMSVARSRHTATLLSNGRVLITGGSAGGIGTTSAELYDPATNTFTPTGPMVRDRVDHTATLLPDGRVLIIGGWSNAVSGITFSIEYYDPASGIFSLGAQDQFLLTNREGHSATVLPGGDVLVTGGLTSGIVPTRRAEIYSVAWGRFVATNGDMVTPRAYHAAIASELPDGHVLLIGGISGTNVNLATVEKYDHATRTFQPAGSMQWPRSKTTATLLPDSSVLVTGGNTGYGVGGDTTEISKFTHCGPQITLLSPTSGQWGTPVTISGAQFGAGEGQSTVTFNGVQAPVGAWTDTQIMTSVPHGATAGPVVVTVNGRASNGPTFTVGAPDLTIVGIAASPASPVPGQAVTITVTVRNAGDLAVGPFRVDFYKHSPTPPLGWGDFNCLLDGLPAATNGTCVGTVSYAAVGTQSLWAVIDVPGEVQESNESNNVFGPQSLVVQTAIPDLEEIALANPPATGAINTMITVSDTVRNTGTGPAASTTTRYFLSLDTVKSGNDIALQNRSVPALAAGASNSATLSALLNNTLPLGEYYIIVCADGLNTVNESNEANNCRVSTSRIRVIAADLIISGISNPPAQVELGANIVMTESTQNVGQVAAAASTTRYWLSTDTVKSTNDRQLGTRSVPALAQGASSTSIVTLRVFAKMLPYGFYYVIACADDLQNVVEANNDNNCAASGTRMEVIPGDIIIPQ